MRHSFHISHISLYHYIIISTLLLLYLKVSNVIKNFIINISIQKFHSSYLVSQQRTVSIYEKALDRHRLIHRMSELHHDEIKGPPSTQTDFVNFLVVISGNYNYEITISFAPETRVIRGWIIVSPKLLANELPPEAVLPRIINWPQQKALNATESPNHVAWVCNNRKWRNVATFVTFFHEQWEISFPFFPIFTRINFPIESCARHPFIRSTIFVPILSSCHFVEVSIEKNEKMKPYRVALHRLSRFNTR